MMGKLFTFQKGKKARKPIKFKRVSISGLLKPIGTKVRARREKIHKERKSEVKKLERIEKLRRKRQNKREMAFAKFIAKQRKKTKIGMPMRRI